MLKHRIPCLAPQLILLQFVLIFLVFIYPFPLAAQAEEVLNEKTEISKEDLKIGERLFYGLLPLGKDAKSCASCHNVARIDTFNWNPSAYEIARVYSNKSLDNFTSVVTDPVTRKLLESHQGYELNEQQLFQLKAFMDKLAKEGTPEEKPVITNMLLFIGLIVLLLLALTDLIITRKLKYKFIHLIVILAAGLFIVKTLAHEAIAIGRSLGYEPSQPIKFSHYVHANENKTDCLYCHSISEYSPSAGIPSANVCMNCHVIVREGTNSGRWEINKLVEAYENDLPIQWIRVHNLPDNVFFSHAQHVTVGQLDCTECHGEVEEMTKIQQVHDLSMGWCLDCHRTTEVNILNNEFYSAYKKLHDDLKSGRIDFVTASHLGGEQCMKCHY